MHQIRFRLGLRPRPLGELTALPQTTNVLLLSEEEGGEGKGEGRRRGMERGKNPHHYKFLATPLYRPVTTVCKAYCKLLTAVDKFVRIATYMDGRKSS